MMRQAILLLCGAMIACGGPEEPAPEASPVVAAPENAKEPPVGSPIESNPLRQGFTQRPAPDTRGLPPPIPPFLTDVELEAAAVLRAELDESDAAEAHARLASLVKAFEEAPSAMSLRALREGAVELVRRGRTLHVNVAELYADYLFPNSEAEADAEYKGRLAVFSGTVAPHNMRDFADGFKLVEQNPYVHDPLLLATDYELSFVECRLARPEFQSLRDWQPIHFLGQVRGKSASDVMLHRCVVLW